MSPNLLHNGAQNLSIGIYDYVFPFHECKLLALVCSAFFAQSRAEQIWWKHQC